MTEIHWLRITAAIAVAALVFFCVPAPAFEFELPAGEVVVGGVGDDGEALLAIRRSLHPRDGSVIVQVVGRRARFFDLPGQATRYASGLPGGRLLLWGNELLPDGREDAIVQIVAPGSEAELRRHWQFSGRAWDPMGNHGPPIQIAGDRKAWGLVDDLGTSFTFGRIRSGRQTGAVDTRENRREPHRTERAVVGRERDLARSTFKWPMGPNFVFLDSDGPVVLVPWSEGAYVMRFSENGSSPLVVPILFDDGVEEYEFRWQWEERILWARTALYWKAWHLWDLGLGRMPEAPLLVIEQTASPHPVSGAVRLVEKEGRYRIERLWRDPWAPVVENRASGWLDGKPSSFFVSPDGRVAVVVESRETDEGEPRSWARRLTLRPGPHLPPYEPDLDAERAADREAMPWLPDPSTDRPDGQDGADGVEDEVRSEGAAAEDRRPAGDPEPGANEEGPARKPGPPPN